MRIFSLDTSFSFLNFAIIEDGKLKLLHYIDSQKKTLENLPKLFQELCIRPEDFDAFAVSKGVGYLTSLRIGITFIKTWAYTLKKPIASYSNLELMAKYTPVPYPKVPYLKISNNIFFQVFDENYRSEVKLYKGEKLKGFGISIELFKEFKLGDKQFFHPFFPFSAYGGIYAYTYLQKNPTGENLFEIEPLYVKPPVKNHHG